MWWKRGERPPGLCDQRFTFAYIFAAVEPGSDNGFALVLPHANTEAMQIFLDTFAATLAEDEHAVMVLDQAGWHGSGSLVLPANVTLVPLPPYSPELNPVERLWLHLKARCLSHRLHADYDAIVDAASTAWNSLKAETSRIASLCSFHTLGSRRSKDRIDGIMILAAGQLCAAIEEHLVTRMDDRRGLAGIVSASSYGSPCHDWSQPVFAPC